MKNGMSSEVTPAATITEAVLGADPSDLHAETILSTSIPVQRKLVIMRPGNVNYSPQVAGAPGSRVVVFRDGRWPEGLEPVDLLAFQQETANELRGNARPYSCASESMNAYFQHRANLLTVGIQAIQDAHGGPALVVIFTNYLEGEEFEFFQEFQKKTADYMETWRAARQEKAAVERAIAEEAAIEQAELARLGKLVRDQNIIEGWRKSRKLIKALHKFLGKLPGVDVKDLFKDFEDGEDDDADRKS